MYDWSKLSKGWTFTSARFGADEQGLKFFDGVDGTRWAALSEIERFASGLRTVENPVSRFDVFLRAAALQLSKCRIDTAALHDLTYAHPSDVKRSFETLAELRSEVAAAHKRSRDALVGTEFTLRVAPPAGSGSLVVTYRVESIGSDGVPAVTAIRFCRSSEASE